jgi:diamine N-acetyltransferase
LDAIRRAGDSALWLTVNSRNNRVRAFYAKHGFLEIGATNFDLYGEQHENRMLHALGA